MHLHKKKLIHALILCGLFSGQVMSETTTYVVKAPVKISIGDWTTSTEYTEWANSGSEFNCTSWAPDTSEYDSGTTFEQSQSCAQLQERTATTIRTHINGTDTEILSETTESKVVSVTNTQEATGTNVWTTATLTGDWEDSGEAYSCSEWTPDASGIELGVTFEQSQTCSQDQERTITETRTNSSGTVTETVSETTETQTVSITNTQEATGTYENTCLTRSELEDLVYYSGEDYSNANTSCITDFSYLFIGNSVKYDITGWDVSNGEDFTAMFQASDFNQDISNWDVSSGIYFELMFLDNWDFYQDISGWNVDNAKAWSEFIMNTEIESNDAFELIPEKFHDY